MNLSNEKLDEMLKNPEVAEYKPWIEQLRVNRDHQPDPKLKKTPTMVVADKDGNEVSVAVPPSNQLVKSYQQIAVNRKFRFNDKDYSETEIGKVLSDTTDLKTRKKIIAIMNDVYKKEAKEVSFIVNGIALNKANDDLMRGFKKPCDSRNLENNIESEVVDCLAKTVTENCSKTSHRFYALRSKIFGFDKLPTEAVSAPLQGFPKSKYSWEEAKKIVLESFNEFDPKMAEIAKKFFDNNWIDASPKEGKRGGAFSMPAPNKESNPYVLVNFQGSARDVITLAHELGHGVHQYLCKDKGTLLSKTPLTLAETASVFGEMLVFKSMLKREKDPKKRFVLLHDKCQSMIGTSNMQIGFHNYETEVHNKIRQSNKPLSIEEISNIWQKSTNAVEGPRVESDDEGKYRWARIPHLIRTPFYVYAYSFGDSVVNSLYSCYEENKVPDFKDKYFEMLSKAGTEHHSKMFTPFGLELSKPDFWNKGINVISGLVDELEKTAKVLGLDKGKAKSNDVKTALNKKTLSKARG